MSQIIEHEWKVVNIGGKWFVFRTIQTENLVVTHDWIIDEYHPNNVLVIKRNDLLEK